MVSDKTEEKRQRGTCGNDGLYSTHDEHGIAQKQTLTTTLTLYLSQWLGKARTITNNQQESQQITDTRYKKRGGGYVSSNNFFDLPKM